MVGLVRVLTAVDAKKMDAKKAAPSITRQVRLLAADEAGYGSANTM